MKQMISNTLPTYSYTPLTSSSSSSSTSRSSHKTIIKMISLISFFLLTLLYYSSTIAQQFVYFNPSEALLDVVNGELPHHVALDSIWKESRKPKIAIIGGGAGGSSAAFFLKHFSDLENSGLETSSTIFETSNYVGGRSTVCWPWNDDPYTTPSLGEEGEVVEEPVELGASIFVEANKNLFKAVKVFNLTMIEHGGEDDGFAIYNGNEFLYQQNHGSWGLTNVVKMIWRYGRTPMKVSSLVKATVKSFSSLYSSEFVKNGPFDSLLSFANSTQLLSPLSVTSQDYFTSNGIAPLFTDELISAATTVNYGDEGSKSHGVAGLVSLAAEGAMSVLGGNRKIFQEFAERSGAEVRLGKSGSVTEIIKLDAGEEGGRSQWIVKTKAGISGTYDAVILAAPFHQTQINLVNTDISIPEQKYVHLYVTFVVTNTSSPSPAYFNLPSSTKISKSIFSTFDSSTSTTPPAFNSLNYLKVLSPSISTKFGSVGIYHVVKIFSPSSLSEELIAEIFGGEENVGKVFRKSWEAYPLLEPINPNIESGLEKGMKELAEIKVEEGFYYVNGLERIVSTMETETISSFNVVGLLLKDFFSYVSEKSWAEWDE